MTISEDAHVPLPEGYRAAGIHVGIKKKRPDMALLVSDRDAAIAGVFTKNKIQAGPVRLCRDRIESGEACRAILINSGNANACTGSQGRVDADEMAAITAAAMNVLESSVMICSTGTIGVPLPMDVIRSGIPEVVKSLTAEGGADAAQAIRTTDSGPKTAHRTISIEGTDVTLTGIAKGAGMIEPDMATMLAFVLTDAGLSQDDLQLALKTSVDATFNRISVDGDQSTNDTVLLMANGASGVAVAKDTDAWTLMVEAVTDICKELAQMIVRDGEGATKFVTVRTIGAASHEDAEKAVRAISNSLLVKTSWFGCDPNWGRVIDAVGYSGAEVVESSVDIYYDQLQAVKDGMVNPDTELSDLEAVLQQDAFTVTVDLNLGSGAKYMYACDCSHEYVRINSEYTT